MPFIEQSEKIRLISSEKILNQLKNHYSQDIINAFNVVNNQDIFQNSINPELLLMQVTYQLSGYNQTEEELGLYYAPIYCFFLGTTFQDDLLDSIDTESPRNLVEKLGKSTCLIMGDILYNESKNILYEISKNSEPAISKKLTEIIQSMISKVFEMENFRRQKIGKILTRDEFFRIWKNLTPNKASIELGGVLANLDQSKIELLSLIGTNFSIINRITKETNEIFGLHGSLVEKFKTKPVPLPITLAYESANEFEQKDLEQAVKKISEISDREENKEQIGKNVSIIMTYITKYDSLSNTRKLQGEFKDKTNELISKLENSEQKEILLTLVKNIDIFNISAQ